MRGWKSKFVVGAAVAILAIAGAAGGRIAAGPGEGLVGCVVLREVPRYQVKVDLAAPDAPSRSTLPAAPVPTRPARQDACK